VTKVPRRVKYLKMGILKIKYQNVKLRKSSLRDSTIFTFNF